ncbi:MAG: ThiF family adenylyltransferase [Gemmatimonadaceae bacterium]
MTVIPRGWDVAIDSRIHTTLEATNPLVSLAAGAIGASEIFRQVFADFLPSGRRGPTPAGFNLLTLAGPSEALPALPPNIDIGRACLVGAGAIGQAMVYALGTISVRGVLDVIDPEEITLSNLQRYVLSGDEDVGRTKVSVVARALKGTAIQVATGQLAWDLALPGLDAVDTVCTAVDSEALRIEIQACLPRRAFNAWTQPSDIGWSRHEAFGVEPCLACLYWPTSPRPNYHQLVARSIRENELRVLAYLTHDISIDAVLNPALLPQIPDMPAPSNASEWFERSLLADVVRNFDLGEADAEAWRGRRLSDLYHDGVCGGALIRHGSSDLSRDIAVPLAHQSALAGVMLAAQLLIASCPDLTAYRHPASEARLNLLAGFPQLSARPRARTLRCICGDADFTQRFAAKWLSPVVTPSDANA